MTTVVHNFRDCLISALSDYPSKDADLSDFIKELQTINCDAYQPQDLAKRPDASVLTERPATVIKYLQNALDKVDVAPDLASAVKSLADVLNWYQIFQGDGIERTLAEGLIAGQMAGQIGLVPAGAIRTGLFLLAPGISYPLHQHGAFEFYFVVSGKLILQHGTTGQPFSVLPGQISVTPRNLVHSLSVEDDPCLVIYAWIDDVESPNWWWERDGDGVDWHRVCWERQPDARWIKTRVEPVTESILKEAGEL